METDIKINSQCEECLKHTKCGCIGKTVDVKVQIQTPLYFGTKQTINKKLSGLKLCKDYEFDERLYTFDDGSRFGHADTIDVILKRKGVREKEEAIHDNCEAVDLGETLSSADLENLI